MCKAFNYDYRCTAVNKSHNSPTDIEIFEIFEISTGKVVLAYRIPYSRKAWCNASATLMVIAEGPESLAEIQAHYKFAA